MRTRGIQPIEDTKKTYLDENYAKKPDGHFQCSLVGSRSGHMRLHGRHYEKDKGAREVQYEKFR